jgi:hypothetical protein
MKTYTIELTYLASGKKETIEIKSRNINWSMDQYMRNRMPFEWQIIATKDEDKN